MMLVICENVNMTVKNTETNLLIQARLILLLHAFRLRCIVRASRSIYLSPVLIINIFCDLRHENDFLNFFPVYTMMSHLWIIINRRFTWPRSQLVARCSSKLL